MKKFLKIGAAVAASRLLTPWMDSWGATQAEIGAAYPGDELVPAPASFINRAASIRAKPEDIYPWIVQIGAKKVGWYGYSWLEGMLNCTIANAEALAQP